MTLGLYGILSQAISGLGSGMAVFLCALGLSIAFGALKVLNLAHGSIFMVGMYLCYTSSLVVSQSSSLFLGILFGVVGCGLVGAVLEIIVLRRIYEREELDQFMVTYGFTFIFMDLVKLVWGTEYHTISLPKILRGPIEISGMSFPKYNVCVVVFGIIIFVVTYFFIEKTKWGVLIRGVTVDRDMMSALGLNVPRIFTLTFTIACGLSGLGGAVMGGMTCIAPGVDLSVLLESFIIIVIGGLGSITGAFLGAILFGLVNSFGILLIPKMAIGFPFFLMLIVLIVRPFGLLGKKVE